MREQIETLRKRSEAYLEKIAGKPLSAKMKRDAALLDSDKATKH